MCQIKRGEDVTSLKDQILTSITGYLYLDLNLEKAKHYGEEERKQKQERRESQEKERQDEQKHQTTNVEMAMQTQPQRSPGEDEDDAALAVDEANSSKVDRTLLPDLTCTLCNLFLYRPITTFCGHSFCSSCFQSYLQSERERLQALTDYEEDEAFDDQSVSSRGIEHCLICPYPYCGHIFEGKLSSI